MARSKVAKSKRPEAERAAEHYLFHVFGCEPDQIERAVRTQWQSVDFWGCDAMGRAKDGRCYFAQVTAGQNEAVRVRRRKLDKISWNPFETVVVLQLVEQPNPAFAQRKDFYFRVHRLIQGNWSVDTIAHPVPKEWFKKLRVDDDG